MHLKRWFLVLCLATLVAGEFFLFKANREKDALRVQLNEARHIADQAQAELKQYQGSVVTAQGAENDRLRKENQKLTEQVAQLRNENTQLRSTNQMILQQQQEQLQQWADAYQQVHAAAQAAEAQAEAQSNRIAAQAEANRKTCINNLRQIDAAKKAWALENNKPLTAVPTVQDLLPYLPNEVFPVCPSGGNYTINAVGVPPTCSIPGHALPQSSR